MSDKQTPGSRRLDDELADFTDRFLAGEVAETQNMVTEDPELSELQHTVIRMQGAFHADEPDEAMSRRIREKLVSEWEALHSEASDAGISIRERLQRIVGPRGMARRQVYAFAALVAILVVGLLVVVLSPEGGNGGEMTGAAGPSGLLPSVFLIVVALAGVVWWLIRRSRE